MERFSEMLGNQTRKSTDDHTLLIQNKLYLLESRRSLQTRYPDKLNAQLSAPREDRDGILDKKHDIKTQLDATLREIARLRESLVQPERADLQRLVYC